MRNSKNISRIIGNNIQKARLKCGLTQEKLAERCNVSTKYISAIERGISSGSISIIIKICDTLSVTPNYIFNNILDFNKLNEQVTLVDFETSIDYIKLKPENKEFVKNTIEHLYSMQIKR